ncbi:C-GCAxxG-C-C family protein [Bacteroidota bacterium]
MEDVKKKAIELFNNGFNCSQVVLNAFSADLGLNDEQALKIATAFGGGMAKQQFICGAVTGAYMVLGLKYGKFLKGDEKSKIHTYEMVHQFNSEFIKHNKSIHCKDILGHNLNTEKGKKIIEENNLIEVKCEKAINTAIEILDELINK